MNRIITSTLVFLISSFCLTAMSSFASPIVLYVDDDAAAGGDGLSWSTAYRFLDDALLAATAAEEATEIRVAGGQYRPDRSERTPEGTGDRAATFVVSSGMTLRGGFAGLDDPANPDAHDRFMYESILTADLAGDDGTIKRPMMIDDNAFHVVSTSAKSDDLTIDGFRIIAGYPNGGVDGDVLHTRGGGLLINQSQVEVRNCLFELHLACGLGFGGEGEGGEGAAIFASESDLDIEECVFYFNSAEAAGGAIALRGGTASIRHCTFQENTVFGKIIGFGGAVDAFEAVLTIEQCHFKTNFAFDGGGGALAIRESSDSFVLDSTFVYNKTRFAGAAILHRALADGLIAGCIFRGNSTIGLSGADHGGGVGNVLGSHPTIVNCEFTGNSAGAGGAVSNLNGSSPLVLNCTMVENVAAGSLGSKGGAVHAATGASPTIINSIVWANLPEQIDGGSPTVSYSCVQGGFAGEGIISEDPLFVRNPHPGPQGIWEIVGHDFGSIQLRTDSPAIDAGDTPSISDEFDTDLAGSPRVVDWRDAVDTGIPDRSGFIVDLGAHEYQGVTPCPTDLNGDQIIGFFDLLVFLDAWVNGDAALEAMFDFSGDSAVDGSDLSVLLDTWGACSQ